MIGDWPFGGAIALMLPTADQLTQGRKVSALGYTLSPLRGLRRFAPSKPSGRNVTG